jgi:NTE family protein
MTMTFKKIIRFVFVKARLIISLFLLVAAFPSPGQKVGLVLSGGGAKGLAHIGVIKALEENHIPIDYITGTSMGAIVGSLYAAGFTPEQMISIVTSPEFQDWAYGNISDKYLYYFKKKEPDASWVDLNFRYDTIIKPVFPTNFIPPHMMDFAFMELTGKASAASDYDFDSLFVPFRCVASDVYANESVVFSKGDLGSSVRASMTFPFYFKPISINGKLLFDGGIYNNFPVNVMTSDFKPDYIIGSKVASNTSPEMEDDIMAQLENMITVATNYSVPDSNGILIQPNVNYAGLMDFQLAKELIRFGYEATMAKMDQIKKLIPVRKDSLALITARSKFLNKEHPLVFKNIEITGLNNFQKKYLVNNITLSNDTFTLEYFKRRYFQIITDDQIESIYPTSKFNPQTGYYDLRLAATREKRFNARIGGNISSSNLNMGFFGAEYKYLREKGYTLYMNGYYGRFYSSLLARLKVDYYTRIPIIVQAVAAYNRFDYYRSSAESFYEDIRPPYVIQRESYAKSDISIPLRSHAKGTFGITLIDKTDKYYQTIHFMKSDTADQTNFRFGTPFITYDGSSLNYPLFPTSGFRTFFQFRYVNGFERFIPGSTSIGRNIITDHRAWIETRMTLEQYFRLNSFLIANGFLELNYSNQPFFNNYLSTIIASPVFAPIPHLQTLFIENFRNPVYAAGGIKAIMLFSNHIHLRLEGYIFQPYKIIENTVSGKPKWGDPYANRYGIVSSSLVYQSPIGPVSLTASYYNKPDQKIYVIFNIGYLIFNKRAFD